MRPEVVSAMQDNVDAFLSRCEENLGRSVDIYVSVYAHHGRNRAARDLRIP